MKVILLEDIKSVGKKQDLLNVSDGYARNYLLPKKLAVEATNANLNELSNKKSSEENKKKQILEEAQTIYEKINGKIIKLEVKCGTNGKLFGSVTNKEIRNVILEQFKIDIDKKKISLVDTVKSVGEYEINIKLHPKVTAKMTLNVIAI